MRDWQFTLLVLAILVALFLALVLHTQLGFAQAYTTDDTLAAIDAASAGYGVSARELRAVVSCESKYDPYAIGRYGEQGAVQIKPGDIEEHRFYEFYGYGDPWSPYESVEFLAREILAGRGSHWSCF
jgi:hypothetical protein